MILASRAIFDNRTFLLAEYLATLFLAGCRKFLKEHNLRILLVRPPKYSMFSITPQLLLGYVSSSLKKAGYNDIHLLDGSLTQCNEVEASEIAATVNPDIIVMEVDTGYERWARGFTKEVRARIQKIIVVVEGAHITALKSLALDFIEPDFGILGEVEQSIVEFANHIDKQHPEKSDVSGLMYREEGRWVQSKNELGVLVDVNEIPFPDWELLNPRNYFTLMDGANIPQKGKRPTVIMTSRGCPYKCTFCSARTSGGRTMRYREAKNVVDEIKFLKNKYGVDEIIIVDDNLTMDLKRAEELFDLMIEEQVNVFWRANQGLRADRLNEKVVEKMARSGCYAVGLGVESGNKEVQKSIKKSLDIDKVNNSVELLHQHDIKVIGFFLCGLIGETKEQIKDTINFALKVPFDRIQMGVYAPYPGNEDFNKIFQAHPTDQYPRLMREFQEYGVIPKFRDMSDDELVVLQKQMILKFYLRPRILISLLLNLNWRQIKAIFNHPHIRNWIGRKKRLFTIK